MRFRWLTSAWDTVIMQAAYILPLPEWRLLRDTAKNGVCMPMFLSVKCGSRAIWPILQTVPGFWLRVVKTEQQMATRHSQSLRSDLAMLHPITLSSNWDTEQILLVKDTDPCF